MNLTAFLREQGKKYQSHLIKQNKLSTALHFQRNIQLYKSIPKQYLPPSGLDMPTNDNESLVVEFTRAYEEIFFQHLDKVIIHNTISLELEEAHLRNITSPTVLSDSGLPPQLPPSSPPPTPPQTQNPSITHSSSKRKRKRCQRQKAVKKPKTIEAVHSPAANNTGSFLSQRPNNKDLT